MISIQTQRLHAQKAAMPLISANWASMSAARIGALCGLSEGMVRRLAKEMRLPDRARGGRATVARGADR